MLPVAVKPQARPGRFDGAAILMLKTQAAVIAAAVKSQGRRMTHLPFVRLAPPEDSAP